MGNNILTAVFLFSVCSVGGLSEQSPVSRTVALEGQTAVLPCTFTFTSIERLTIEWTKNDEKDLSPTYVFTFRSSHEDYHMKNPKFQHRTQLFMDELHNGNASLRISDVSLSDTGKYKCKTIQDLDRKEREVELFVGGLPEQSPAYRTVALEGQTALLPCTFTFNSIERLTIEWTKDDKDLSPNIVFLLNSGHEEDDIKNQLFWHRTHLFMDELSKGNASLRISNVSLSDAGKYKCKTFQDSGQNEREVDLFVGSGSEPKFLEFSIEAEGVSLRCEASCWFPEPQMTFLDEQGKVINAEISTTERREGTGCFTVTGRITAQSAGRFICRVHQPNISLTRDAEIYVQTQSRAEHVTYILLAMGVAILVSVAGIICIVFRRKLFKCVRRQKSLQLRSGRDIERQKYENGASTCEDDNIENENPEPTKGLNGPDQNQTSVSLSRSVPVVSNSRERPPHPPVQENCSRPEPLNALLSPKSTDSPDLQKTGSSIQSKNSAPAQLSSTSVKHRSRLTSLSLDSTPETSPLMEDSEH